MFRLRLLDKSTLIQLHTTLCEALLYRYSNDRNNQITPLMINHSKDNRLLGLELIKIITDQLRYENSYTPHSPLINPSVITKVESIDIGNRSREFTLIHTPEDSYLVSGDYEKVIYEIEEVMSRFARQ